MSSQFWSIWLVYYFSFLLLLFRGVGWANQVFRVGPCRGQQLVVVNSSLLVGASQARWPSLLCCPSLRREGESRLFERRNEVNCVNFFVGREKSRRVLTPREKAKDARRSESSMAASLFFFILGMWHTRTCYCSTHTHTRRDLLIISFFSFSDIFCDSFRFDSFSFLFFLPLDMATFSSFPLHHLSLLWMLYGGALLSFFCCCCNRHSTMYTIATIPHGGYDWTFVNYSKKKKRKKKICCTTISFGKKCYIMTCSIGSGKICDVVSHLFLLLFLFPFHYIGGKGWKSFKGILFLLLIVCIWCDFSSSVPPISYRSACRPLLNHIFYSSFFPLLQFTLVTHYMMAMTYISSLK